MTADLAAHMQFRNGLRWPFREGDTMEFWRCDHVLVLALPYELVMRAVRMYLDGAMLQTAVAERLARKPLTVAAPRRALPFTSEQRRAFRDERRKNKGKR